LKQSPAEALRGFAVSPLLNQDVPHDAVLLDGTPQMVLDAWDANEHLVHMPTITRLRSSSHSVGEGGREFLAPPPDCLVRDDHAALGRQQFDITQADTENMIQAIRRG
jgi:hypothetical protein